jgi:hypothetical protein
MCALCFEPTHALQALPNLKLAAGIVQVYQDFIEFQENAAAQLLNDTFVKVYQYILMEFRGILKNVFLLFKKIF